MKYPYRLSLRFVMPLALLTFTAIAGLYILHASRKHADLNTEQEMLDRLTQQMTQLQGALELLISKGDSTGAQRLISSAASVRHLSYAFLTDEKDRITAATRFDWIGQPVEEILEIGRFSDAAHIADIRNRLIGSVHLVEDRQAMEGYYPVTMGRQRGELRPSLVGILFMQYDLTIIKAEMRRAVDRQVMEFSLFLVGLSVMFGIYFHFALTRRSLKLIAATRRFAAGDLNARSDLSGKDELAQLSQAFNDMVHQISKHHTRLKERSVELAKVNKQFREEITERKRAEEALQEAHVELENRVKERTTELIAAQDQIIRSERLAATGQLAASVAHENNSTLQAITVLLGAMKRDNEEDKELLDNIVLLKGAFFNIRDTVKNLMDLNRPGKERKQMINVNAITESTVALMKSHLKKNKVKIDLNLSPTIPDMIASPQQLGHVFLNLINNAVEAMTSVSKSEGKWKEWAKVGGDISIKTMLKKDKVVIQVSDTGPGIAEEDLEHIFDPFYTRKKTMGTGVGLSICNGIIEDHDGTIEAKNAKEGGAVFTVTLPVKKG